MLADVLILRWAGDNLTRLSAEPDAMTSPVISMCVLSILPESGSIHRLPLTGMSLPDDVRMIVGLETSSKATRQTGVPSILAFSYF